jgi:polar amino acid transport system substrate-binding protein
VAQARRTSRLAAAVAALALVASACGNLPKDPEGTLDRVSGDTMRVGITDNDPWAIYDEGEAEGTEVRILEAFAEEIDAEIEWHQGTEEDLMTALELRELDVVIGGLTSTNPWSAMVALTHPYLTTSVVVAVPDGDEIPEDIAGMGIAVEKGTEQAGILEKEDAKPVPVDDVATQVEREGTGSVTFDAFAIENWLIDDLDLEDTDVTLIETDHVMATPMGENAWLVRLERFLLTNEEEIESILDEEART